jgi:hypothetical protein
MRRLLLTLGLVLLWCAPSEAAWALVGGAQTQQSSGDDQTITFGVAPSASNKVLVAVAMGNKTQTIQIQGWGGSVTETTGQVSSVGFTISAYIFCLTPDGADNTFVVFTSGAATAQAVAAEFSGGSCTQDGSTSSNDITGTSPGTEEYVLTTDITTTNAGSMLFGIVFSTTAANFAPGTNMTQLGTDTAAGAVEYRILTVTGTYDTPYSAAANESAMLLSVALQPASTARPCILGGGFVCLP